MSLSEPCAFVSFNLVIERLLISGGSSAQHVGSQRCLKFQSRYRAASHFRSQKSPDGVTATSMFQSRYRAASHFRRIRHDLHVARFLCRCFNLVIERLLISGSSRPQYSNHPAMRFNLVIERLLISGFARSLHTYAKKGVSISLSSGFSFQVPSRCQGMLLTVLLVSISLSSGFSFQVGILYPQCRR